MRFAWMLLFLAGCPPASIPRNDTCSADGSGTLAQLEVGADAADGSEPPFTPWHDGDTVPVVRGGQGATMIVARLRASGSSVPGCIQAGVQVTDAMGEPAEMITDLFTTYGSDASRTTHAIYLPGIYPLDGLSIRVTATSLGASASVDLTVAR